MPYQIFVTPKAQRQIRRLPEDIQRNVREAIRSLRENPRPHGVKKLVEAEGLYRARVGDYRILYAVEDQLLLLIVLTVGHRKDIYKRLKKFTPERVRSLVENALIPKV